MRFLNEVGEVATGFCRRRVIDTWDSCRTGRIGGGFWFRQTWEMERSSSSTLGDNVMS